MQSNEEKNAWSVEGLPEWLTVARAYQICDKVMHRKLAEVGLTVPQYDLLMSLMKKDGQTQQELASRLLVVKSNVSSLLSRAEREGWIRRESNPSDARRKVVSLTGRGKRLAKRGWRVQAEVVTTMLGAMTADELGQVADVMRRVRAALLPLLDGDEGGRRV